MLVVDLGKWMNKILIDWGIDPKVADRFDETIIALLMIAIAIGLNYLCQAILIGGMKQYTRRKPHLWNTLLMKRKVFHNLIHTIPAFLVYALLPMAFVRGKDLLLISQKACAVYIIFSLLLAVNGILHLRWKGVDEEPPDEGIHSGVAGTFVLCRRNCNYCYYRE